MQELWERARHLRAEALGLTAARRREFVDTFFAEIEPLVLARANAGNSCAFWFIRESEHELVRECFLTLEDRAKPFELRLTDDERYVKISWI